MIQEELTNDVPEEVVKPKLKRGPKPTEEKVQRRPIKGRPPGSKNTNPAISNCLEYFPKYCKEKSKELMAQPIECIYCKSILTFGKLKRHLDNTNIVSSCVN